MEQVSIPSECSTNIIGTSQFNGTAVQEIPDMEGRDRYRMINCRVALARGQKAASNSVPLEKLFQGLAH